MLVAEGLLARDPFCRLLVRQVTRLDSVHLLPDLIDVVVNFVARRGVRKDAIRRLLLDTQRLALHLHLRDGVIDGIHSDGLLPRVQLHALVHLLLPHEVHDVAKLLLQPIRGNLSLLNLKDLDQVPLLEMIVATQVVLNLENRHRLVSFLLDGQLLLQSFVLDQEQLEEHVLPLRQEMLLEFERLRSLSA